jgi:hypothetical protein
VAKVLVAIGERLIDCFVYPSSGVIIKILLAFAGAFAHALLIDVVHEIVTHIFILINIKLVTLISIYIVEVGDAYIDLIILCTAVRVSWVEELILTPSILGCD